MGKRFIVSDIVSDKDGLTEGTKVKVFIDTQTGVQYLLARWANVGGNVGGLAVLVDKDGKPLLDERYAKP